MTSPTDPLAALRREMVQTQLRRRDIRDRDVLAAMERVPRHRFIPGRDPRSAYADGPREIGHGQTISQPYIVACMTQALRLERGHRVLDVGTGSGYQAAILAELGCDVYSIEIVAELAARARGALAECGYRALHLRQGDGYLGWEEASPFDAIVVAAAPDHVPDALARQLRVGGRLILPVGDCMRQRLVLIERTARNQWTEQEILPVLFVPMTGAARRRRR